MSVVTSCICKECDTAFDSTVKPGKTNTRCPECRKTNKVRMRCTDCQEDFPGTRGSVRCQTCRTTHKTVTALRRAEREQALRSQVRQRTDYRSPLRKAWESEQWDVFLREVKERCTQVGDCHIWSAGADKSGYPFWQMSKGSARVRLSMHRVVLQAKHGGRELGTQAAHHMCGNSMCVNPEHLQPVTHRENVAEMLARNSYLARIRELESELANLDPNNKVLQGIPFA